jgi:hypothetical protein
MEVLSQEGFVLEPAATADHVSVSTVSSMHGEDGTKLAKVHGAFSLSRLPE